ncbi:MAG: PKD domain-containing protein [Sphingobacteriales bacterium]|nr:MAG: PKD domain-containing protein [Sphingobacteriales bacterium]
MKRRYVLSSLFFLLIPFITQAQYASLEFIENQGQWDAPFQYRTKSERGNIFLQEDGLTYMLSLPSNEDLVEAYHHGQIKEQPVLKYHAYKMVFEGANNPEIKGTKRQAHYNNYYLGNDPTRWKTGIHPYQAIDYTNLYDGIDLHIASEKGNLKYDFIVGPGKDPSVIRLRYEGADRLELKGNVVTVKTSVGDVMEMQPYAYQYVDGEKREVPCRYQLKGNTVTYSFPKGFNKGSTLVIDPTVVFCTFTGSTADNWGFTATYDASGNFYAGGLVHDVGFPVSTGAFQTTYAGGTSTSGSLYACDMGIMKLDATGSTRIWATYIGGADNDQPHSMIVDPNDNLIVAGKTYSGDYPVTSGCFDNLYNGAGDIVLTKLNATGTALIGSTFIGGSAADGVNFHADEFIFGGLKHNYGDDARSEVLIDNQLNVYLTASTMSTNFPTTANAIKSTMAAGDPQDGVVMKLTPNLTALTWATYLGGSANDAGYVIALSNNQSSLYVAGGTESNDFPSTPGTMWPSYQGGAADGYVAKFQNGGSFGLQKVSFIGMNDYDQVYGVQVDAFDDVYLMGQTLGGTFPVSSGVYSNPGSSQFILKTNSDLAVNLVSTVFGSGDPITTNISPVAFLVDTCQNVYISGWGGGLGFSPTTVGNTFNMPLSTAPNPPAQSTTDGNDFYFIVFSQGLSSLLYGTYYGRSSQDPGKGEHVDGGTSRFDKNGVVYQAICGACAGSPGIPATPFPTTAGSWSPNNGFPGNCNEVALKIAFQLGSLNAEAIASPDARGCAPFTVQFQNNSTNAASFEWTFGDNTPVSNLQTPPPHTYNNAGTYTVRLIVQNPQACNITVDTTFLTIIVDSVFINADFDFDVTDSCGPFVATFTNTSTPGTNANPVISYSWNFGDGSTFNGPNPGPHTYPDTGCYTVTLVMTDTATCNKIDTVTKEVCIRGFLMKAAFNAPDSLCIGTGALMANATVNSQSVVWHFGDGNTSTAFSPVYSYTTPGTYTITLVASNPNSCNKVDSVTRTIRILPQPVANFDYTPLVPVPNEIYRFNNLSIDAVSYFWSFGDGESSTDVHPTHQYNMSGNYTVCLQAKSISGCVDTVCRVLEALVAPAIGVPTAFSPNGDGENDVLYVRGAAIKTLNFKVYNRFGELVFQTDDKAIGWDGTYKGKLQEMEAYAWVLNATFINGTSASQTGNVTLLR